MGITTYQPKWHYTFDRHLERQYSDFRGLADNTDDHVEKQHQKWAKMEGQFNHITSFKRREKLKRHEMWRNLHPYLEYFEDYLRPDRKHDIESKRSKERIEAHIEEERQKFMKRSLSRNPVNDQNNTAEVGQPHNEESGMLVDVKQEVGFEREDTEDAWDIKDAISQL